MLLMTCGITLMEKVSLDLGETKVSGTYDLIDDSFGRAFWQRYKQVY